MLRLPPALRARHIGGVSFAGEARKRNFLQTSGTFLQQMAEVLNLEGEVSKVEGAKSSSGCVEFRSDQGVIRLHEPEDKALNERQGLVIEIDCSNVHQTAMVCDFHTDMALEDWIYGVKKLIQL